MRDDFLALYGLKHHPFRRGVPRDALWTPPGSDAFLFRLETISLDGGFAMICGEPGLGKSKILQLVAERLLKVGGEVVVGVMERPQGSVCDFYRELGELFGVSLAPSNRYGGFKALRERWRQHIQATLLRPILLIDEAQEMSPQCLTELRLLGSARFDSECLLTTVLCGDARLPELFRLPQLAPLGSRIRTRWFLEPWDRKILHAYLEHALDAAGAPHLMTDGLKKILAEHAAGNIRMLCGMAEELINAAIERKQKQLDEQLYLDVFNRKTASTSQRTRSRLR